jgi:hypothetical protein
VVDDMIVRKVVVGGLSKLKSKSKQEELFIFDCTAQGGFYKFVRNYEFSKFPINNLVVNWFLVHKFFGSC